LVSILKLSIVASILLNGIVGQMNEWLLDGLLAERELLGAHSYVGFFKQVTPLISQVTAVYKNPKTNVELSRVNQQGLFDILLDNKDF
jgi:hypothetical protein